MTMAEAEVNRDCNEPCWLVRQDYLSNRGVCWSDSSHAYHVTFTREAFLRRYISSLLLVCFSLPVIFTQSQVDQSLAGSVYAKTE
jgi:hypothetical protein